MSLAICPHKGQALALPLVGALAESLHLRVTKLGVYLWLKVGSEYCSPLRGGELSRSRRMVGEALWGR